MHDKVGSGSTGASKKDSKNRKLPEVKQVAFRGKLKNYRDCCLKKIKKKIWLTIEIFLWLTKDQSWLWGSLR